MVRKKKKRTGSIASNYESTDSEDEIEFADIPGPGAYINYKQISTFKKDEANPNL